MKTMDPLRSVIQNGGAAFHGGEEGGVSIAFILLMRFRGRRRQQG
jgi:hypothetical protein